MPKLNTRPQQASAGNPSSRLSWMRTLEQVDPRQWFSRAFGTQFNGLRDLYAVFGWDRQITDQQAWGMYLRGGIANRVIHAYPDAIWSAPPEVEATAGFQNAWEKLVAEQDLWTMIHRADVLSRLSRYSILVVGTDDSAKMDQPLEPSRVTKILYMQPYAERSAKIARWGQDPKDARFSLPVEYLIQPTKDGLEGSGPASNVAIPSFRVHWSRVIHFNQGALENNVFGVPALWPIWNYLTDLQKVVGGSSESYWLTANRGMHANVDPEMEMDAEDEGVLSQELDEYQHGLRRFIRTRGVDVKSLGAEVSNPDGPFNVLVALIAGTTKTPRRILLGSEAAHNASTQDKGNWADALTDHRVLVSAPYVLKPLIQGFQRMGFLPQVNPTKLTFTWEDSYRLSPLERSQESNQKATAANNLTLALKNVSNLLSVEEGRLMLGLEGPMVGTPAKIIQPPVKKNPNQPAGAGGENGLAAAPGNKGGTKSTPTSDAGGKGAPAQKQK